MTIIMDATLAKFAPGQIRVTSGAQEKLSCYDLALALTRHLTGDWGELVGEERKSNEQSLTGSGRLLSRFANETGTVHWVVTEADRSATTVLLPEEY
jgi:hypothetical protein